MFRHRLILLGCMIFCALALLIYRLYLIQIGEREHFGPHQANLVEAARRQQERVLISLPLRGKIVDRDGHSLLGSPQKGVLVFPALFHSASAEDWQRVAAILNWSLADLQAAVQEMKGPHFLRDPGVGQMVSLTKEQIRLFEPLRTMGIAVVSFPWRYGEGMIAKHAIGFVSQDPQRVEVLYPRELEKGLISQDVPIGQAGLERTFEPFLQDLTGTSKRVVYTTDGRGKPLFGASLGLEEAPDGDLPLTVRTTIDAELQRTTEQALDEVGVKKGAVAVLDVKNGDILAMASRPNFDPRAVDPQSISWNNVAVKQTVPGSVFKVVVAAAALEEGLVHENTPFVCTGALDNVPFSCWKKAGHGELTFAEGFAQSCNIVFAQLALQLGGEKLEQYARKLGLLQPVGWRTDALFRMGSFAQIDGEEPGQIFSPATPLSDAGVLAQTAIGQRDVQLTPLQAAHLMATIANDGQAAAPRLVQSLQYRNGQTMTEFKAQVHADKPLSDKTIRQLQHLLREVVETGTGQSLKVAQWPLAGKSGTGEYVKGETDNQWFVGYGPADEPKYAVAVVSIDTPVEEKQKAIQVFLRIMDGLAGQKNELAGRKN